MLLLIDNYDSFVHNLARYFQRLGQETVVRRNDEVNAAAVMQSGARAVVLSPGPCTPNEAGCSLDIVRELHTGLPILGVCLGHQTIAAALGGRVVRAAEPVHGRSSSVRHNANGLFKGLPNPLRACRYHSLVVEESSLPPFLEPTAWTDDGTLMALAHRDYPVFGVQFHPESILTDCGYPMLANFLRFAGLSVPDQIPTRSDERAGRSDPVFATALPDRPVTF
jgi:anthranilate synthase/aminodeoxychorismate synthase-like glutamine amidotransferase